MPDSVGVFLNTDTGLDTNDGTFSSPVLTLEKAISVGFSDRKQAISLVINCSGSANLDIGKTTHLPHVDKILDLTQASNKFSFVKIVGSRSNVLAIPAAGSTVSFQSGGPRKTGSQFITLTYSGGETNPTTYTQAGFVHQSGSKNISNFYSVNGGTSGANTLDLVANDTGIEASGFTVFTLNGPKIITENSITVLSTVPVYFENLEIQSGTGSNKHWVNETGHVIQFYNCHIISDTTQGMLDAGKWNLQGCFLSQSGHLLCTTKAIINGENSYFINNVKLYEECTFRTCLFESQFTKLSSVSGNFEKSWFKNDQNIDRYGANLELLACTCHISNCKFSNLSDEEISCCIHSIASTVYTENLETFRDLTVGNIQTNAIKLETTSVNFSKDIIVVNNAGSSTGFCITATNSNITLGSSDSALMTVFGTTGNTINLDMSELLVHYCPVATSDVITGGVNCIVGTDSKITLPKNASGPLQFDSSQTAISLHNSKLIVQSVDGLGYVNQQGTKNIMKMDNVGPLTTASDAKLTLAGMNAFYPYYQNSGMGASNLYVY